MKNSFRRILTVLLIACLFFTGVGSSLSAVIPYATIQQPTLLNRSFFNEEAFAVRGLLVHRLFPGAFLAHERGQVTQMGRQALVTHVSFPKGQPPVLTLQRKLTDRTVLEDTVPLKMPAGSSLQATQIGFRQLSALLAPQENDAHASLRSRLKASIQKTASQISFFTFTDSVADFLGYAHKDPSHNFIALHEALLSQPVAFFHEIGELLLQTGGIALEWSEDTLRVRVVDQEFSIQVLRTELPDNFEQDTAFRNHYLLRALQAALFSQADLNLSQAIDDILAPSTVEDVYCPTKYAKNLKTQALKERYAETYHWFCAELGISKDHPKLRDNLATAAYYIAKTNAQENGRTCLTFFHQNYYHNQDLTQLDDKKKKSLITMTYAVAKNKAEKSLEEVTTSFKNDGITWDKMTTPELQQQYLIAVYNVAMKKAEDSLGKVTTSFKNDGITWDKMTTPELQQQYLIAVYNVAMKKAEDSLGKVTTSFKNDGITWDKMTTPELQQQYLIAVYQVAMHKAEAFLIPIRKQLEKVIPNKNELFSLSWRAAAMRMGPTVVADQIVKPLHAGQTIDTLIRALNKKIYSNAPATLETTPDTLAAAGAESSLFTQRLFLAYLGALFLAALTGHAFLGSVSWMIILVVSAFIPGAWTDQQLGRIITAKTPMGGITTFRDSSNGEKLTNPQDLNRALQTISFKTLLRLYYEEYFHFYIPFEFLVKPMAAIAAAWPGHSTSREQVLEELWNLTQPHRQHSSHFTTAKILYSA